jgi:hypothetical protein
MNKEFVPYELALKLKQLGFDEPCLGFYERNQELIIQECLITDFHGDSLQCVAPLFQQAFRWFREKYGLESHIKKDWQYGICLGYESMIECEDGIIDCGTYNIYEEAEFACLEKIIEIVELKQQEQ